MELPTMHMPSKSGAGSAATSTTSTTGTVVVGNQTITTMDSFNISCNYKDDYDCELFTVLQCNLFGYFGAGWTRYSLISDTLNKYKADILCIQEAITSYITPISTINTINKTKNTPIYMPGIKFDDQREFRMSSQSGNKSDSNVSGYYDTDAQFCQYDTFFKSTLDFGRRLLPYLLDSPVWSFLSQITCVFEFNICNTNISCIFLASRLSVTILDFVVVLFFK